MDWACGHGVGLVINQFFQRHFSPNGHEKSTKGDGPAHAAGPTVGTRFKAQQRSRADDGQLRREHDCSSTRAPFTRRLCLTGVEAKLRDQTEVAHRRSAAPPVCLLASKCCVGRAAWFTVHMQLLSSADGLKLVGGVFFLFLFCFLEKLSALEEACVSGLNTGMVLL